MFIKNTGSRSLMTARYNDPGGIPRGRLSFGVFESDYVRPIESASIGIFEGERQIEELIADVSGQTLTIDLPCPPVDYSQDPNSPNKPYGEYNARITAEGYENVVIEGIEVLPDSSAIQNVSMSRGRQGQGEIDIKIKEHTLWGEYPPKTPEDPVKDLPPETGFVVLDKPVIPEFIVVHDGLPDNNAATNYYVHFKDYIKNVASCEIYATWPDSAIRANILAIISFTLNRVFTEWYRNKGKNFTITSSTAYDHAFSYGRNIFEEISVIVDEMFTTYITKEGIRQPLFAQYCDGARSTCPGWMSQWGSKSLSDQGYNAVQIIRNYYGQDAYLNQAEQVSGVPSSFPGTALTEGSTGQNVRTVQNQLNTIANNYPAIKKVRVDGMYGPATREAVQEFQKIFNLPQSGIVDFSTWYKLSEIFVAVAKLAELS